MCALVGVKPHTEAQMYFGQWIHVCFPLNISKVFFTVFAGSWCQPEA